MRGYLRSIILSLAFVPAFSMAAERPPLPPGMGQYIMVMREAVPSAPSAPVHDRVQVPDVAKIGGSKVSGDARRQVVIIPNGVAKQLRDDPNVDVLQRLWMGESAEEWQETEGASARFAPRSEFEETGDTWASGAYQYDGSGNIKAIGSSTYIYDSAHRLIKSTVDGVTETYRYDSFGNLIEKTTGSSTTTIPVDANNRLSGEVHDEIGNVRTRTGVERYDYDAVGMVAAVRGEDRSLDRRMIYTADDERIGIMWDDSMSSGYGDETNNTYWTLRDFGGKPLRQFSSYMDNYSWYWERDYVYENGRLVGGERVANLDEGPLSNGQIHFHLDHLGSVRMITNSVGLRYGRHDYYPFGSEQTSSIQEVTNFDHNRGEPLRFTSHERDFHGIRNLENLDYLDYMHARMYEPNLGRFLSVDPGDDSYPSEPQSWNKYSYVRNNPVNASDPTGMFTMVIDVRPGAAAISQSISLWLSGNSTVHQLDRWNQQWTQLAENHRLEIANAFRLRGQPFATYDECEASGECFDPEMFLPFFGGVAKGTARGLYRAALGAYNAELSQAGRALTKHPEVVGLTKNTIRSALRTDPEINRAAAGALKNIMRNGVRTTATLPRYGQVIQIQIPGGHGARWTANGRFIGFINP